MGIPCNRSELKLRYRPDANEIEAYIADLGEKGRYVKLHVTQETVVKCLPLSGTMKCDQLKGKQKISDVIRDNGRKIRFGFTLRAQVTGFLLLGNSGRFILEANSIIFPSIECPFGKLGKPCRFTEPLSAFTPVPYDSTLPPPPKTPGSEKPDTVNKETAA